MIPLSLCRLILDLRGGQELVFVLPWARLLSTRGGFTRRTLELVLSGSSEHCLKRFALLLVGLEITIEHLRHLDTPTLLLEMTRLTTSLALGL